PGRGGGTVHPDSGTAGWSRALGAVSPERFGPGLGRRRLALPIRWQASHRASPTRRGRLRAPRLSARWSPADRLPIITLTAARTRVAATRRGAPCPDPRDRDSGRAREGGKERALPSGSRRHGSAASGAF